MWNYTNTCARSLKTSWCNLWVNLRPLMGLVRSLWHKLLVSDSQCISVWHIMSLIKSSICSILIIYELTHCYFPCHRTKCPLPFHKSTLISFYDQMPLLWVVKLLCNNVGLFCYLVEYKRLTSDWGCWKTVERNCTELRGDVWTRKTSFRALVILSFLLWLSACFRQAFLWLWKWGMYL